MPHRRQHVTLRAQAEIATAVRQSRKSAVLRVFKSCKATTKHRWIHIPKADGGPSDNSHPQTIPEILKVKICWSFKKGDPVREESQHR